VAYHGNPRYTGDIDVWVSSTRENSIKLVRALQEFGFNVPELTPELFSEGENVVRMGNPPIRIEILTKISGVKFKECYVNREMFIMEDVEIAFIGLEDLKTNKRSSGRNKDLADLDAL
jgi:hypothetical protein